MMCASSTLGLICIYFSKAIGGELNASDREKGIKDGGGRGGESINTYMRERRLHSYPRERERAKCITMFKWGVKCAMF